MRKLSLTAMAFIALFTITSCQKNANKVEGDTAFNDTSYIINGLSDIQAKTIGKYYTEVAVERRSGSEKKIHLSVEGLPENIAWDFYNDSGYPTFSSPLTFDVRFAAPGTYPFKLVTTPDDGSLRKEYDVNLKVDTMSVTECNAFMAARLQYTNQLLYTKNANDSVVSTYTRMSFDSNRLTAYLNTVLISEPQAGNNYGIVTPLVEIQFSCIDGSITIPSQEVKAYDYNTNTQKLYTISGSGKIDALRENMTLSYTTELGTYTIVSSFKY